MKPLIFVPTYNERENVAQMRADLQALPFEKDLLFLDDNSPDGTGALLDDMAQADGNISVIHRMGKLGIGSAHVEGLAWARGRGYTTVVTMDCDFTHDPAVIGQLLAHANDYDVVVGSRYILPDGLPGWNWRREFLTRLGHFATRFLLAMPYDATGAFRVYRLDRVPQAAFVKANASGYSFFFQSLYILHRNGARIKEVPIVLPARMYGHSKMHFGEVVRSVQHLFRVFWLRLTHPEAFRI